MPKYRSNKKPRTRVRIIRLNGQLMKEITVQPGKLRDTTTTAMPYDPLSTLTALPPSIWTMAQRTTS